MVIFNGYVKLPEGTYRQLKMVNPIFTKDKKRLEFYIYIYPPFPDTAIYSGFRKVMGVHPSHHPVVMDDHDLV